MKLNKNRTSGFTLIELLLYITIASTILTASSLFLGTLLEARVKNQTIAEVEQQGLQVMQMIAQSVRNADAITAPTQGATSSTLNLNADGTANDPTIFSLSGGAIRISDGGGALPLTNNRVNVSALSFRNLSRSGTTGIIRVEFTLNYINPVGRQEYNFERTFRGSASVR